VSNSNQKLTQTGITPLIDVAGLGNERRVIDPDLVNEKGERIAPNNISVSDGFHVASIDTNPLSPTFGTFSVQNRLSVAAQCRWQAQHIHSVQRPTNQATSATFGPIGGAVLPPLPFGGGSGSYNDTLFPRYGNPIPVATLQAALDANKKAIRTLVFRPNLPTSTPPAPNTFTNWADLYAAYQAQANAGACQIVFEAERPISAPITIPAGVWEFKYGDSFTGPSLGPQIPVILVDGCQIKNVFLFDNGLMLVGQTTGAPQLVWDSLLGTGAPTVPIFQNAAVIRNDGSAPMIVWDQDAATDFLGIGLGFASRFDDSTFEILELQDPGGGGFAVMQFFMQGGGAYIGPNTIRGAGNVGYRVELNAQGVNVSLEQTNYAGLPVTPPDTFAQRAHRRLILTESLDNGATPTLEPSQFARIAPSVDGGAPIVITLPRAEFFPSIICGGKKINGDVNTPVSFIPQGAETIEGAFVYALPLGAYEGVQFFSDGANWFVLP